MWHRLWRIIAWLAGHWMPLDQLPCGDAPTCEGPDLD